ncbi:P-loop containing nucleoside triphosphate hydrolase protein [Fusarium tricinctum]|uniref:P-loop containing nucleoside triphosphate hydrolase protein n=2 Tax=Fusarium tricinctum species complex TaxID=679429 RepID=A0A8K0RRP1_9HYPO|nr:P-loop containing nucleoside triphosphate hydrolase protein [Fusarium tricinctum]
MRQSLFPLRSSSCAMLRLIPRCVYRPKAARSLFVLKPQTFRAFASAVAHEPPKLQLRDYQEECIESVLTSLENGHKRVGISLATGSGKTVIFTQLIDRIPSTNKDAQQTLILAHRRELVEQAANHCQRAYPDKRIEIEMGNVHSTGTADITVASIRSLTSQGRLKKFDPSRFKLLLVDEAHHIVAPGYLKTLRYFGLDEKRPESPNLVGVSATFSRFDGVKLGAAIDEIVYHKDYVDMISKKWLSDVIFTTVESKANLSDIKKGAFGDYLPGELSKAVNTSETNDITVRSWMAKAAGRKSTLVFCVDVAHVIELTDQFRQYGFDARYVTGETAKVERGETLDSFRRGEFPVLVNCGVFTEGTDIPNIDCIILGRPTRSRNLLVQMIGRGMRLHPGKKNCHIIDLVSSLDTGIVTTPTLFGLDPDILVERATVNDLRKIKDTEHVKSEQPLSYKTTSGPASGSVTFTDYDSVLDLIADTSGEKHIRAISKYAWVQVGGEKFVLSAPNGSYVRIERVSERLNTTAPLYRAIEVRALPPGMSKAPYAMPREILTAATFTDAVHGADSFAAKMFPHTFIHRYQKWRTYPPTQGQVDFINKMRGKAEPLTIENLDKGKAADMITKLKHGARGQFAKIEAGQRKKNKADRAAEAKRLREHVKVGPVAS